MENASVLKNGKVIRNSKLISNTLKFDLKGFLISFSLEKIEKKYIHVKKESFDIFDINNKNTSISAGYYLESEALRYFSGLIDQAELSLSRLSDKDIESIAAQNEDTINVLRLYIKSPYIKFYSLEKFAFAYDKNIETIDFDGNIIIPSNRTSSIVDINLNNEGKIFYDERKGLINNFSDSEKDNAAFLITKIALYIKMINEDIFPAFNSGTPNYSQYLIDQNFQWAYGSNILNNPTIETLEDFETNISNYYKAAYPNRLKIEKAEGIEKLYWLGIILDSQALSSIEVVTKLDLLKYLIKNKLNDNFERIVDEELVIKIVSSFNPSNVNEINSFLSSFLHPYETGTDDKRTMYEVLYSKMSTSTNFKQGLLGLSNWILGTSYKPTKTKGQFVEALYILWQFSKYNPYNDNGSLKNSTINFKTSNSIVTFTQPNVVDSLFDYTHYVAYDPVYWNDTTKEIKEYKITRPDAAPILMPYESSKSIGIYFDNFNFSIKEKKIIAYISLPVVSSQSDESFTIIEQEDVQYGTYDIFQPVTILSTDIESKSALSTVNGNDIVVNGTNINSFIPIFVLAFIDADGDSSDAETVLGYTVDVVTTFTGIGNLTKLKHLRWATSGLTAGEVALSSLEGLTIVIGGIEFTSGVLGFFANFVECDENDSFCKEMKTFITIIQLSCLSVNAADGLASLIARRQARRLLRISSNSDNPTIIESDLAIRLGGSEDAEEAAHIIYQFADASSSFDNFLEKAKTIRGLLEGKINKSFELIGKSLFNKFYYNINDLVEITSHISTKVNFVGPLFEKICADFVFIGSKIDKLITKEQLIKQINFFYDEVLIRKFPSGFDNINKFQIFCNKTKVFFQNNFKFWDNDIIDAVANSINDNDLIKYIDDKWGNFNFQERVELIVQGSANRKHLDGDPILHIEPINKPLGNPNDFEFALRMKQKDFEVFTYIARQFAKEKGKIFEFDKIAKKGFMKINDIENLFGKDFVKQFRNTIKNDTNFPGDLIKGDDINFAIIKEGGAYDIEPFLTFKF